MLKTLVIDFLLFKPNIFLGQLAAKPEFSRPASRLSTNRGWRPAKSAASEQ